ncbi:flagellar hook-associated protein FlgK [Candidatus Sumerlaeota bacterium]|nr:flagellar hook-associated protein FlgK [Candidatus Sumerlaeota bacterium]
MTTSIMTIMNIANQGLYAAQQSLQVTGQNIANVNTEGYSRQEAVYEALSNLTGVTISNIIQMRDAFLDTRMGYALQDYGKAEIKQTFIERVETIVDETNQDGIGVALDDFFQALQDLTLDPGGTTERELVRAQAEELCQTMQSTYQLLLNEQAEANREVASIVSSVNEILDAIANINKTLLGSTQGSNELFDQRQVLINDLQELIPSTVINGDGEFFIYAASGMPLVINVTANELVVHPDATNDGFYDVFVRDNAGLEQNVTDYITTSKLGGLLEIRDSLIPDQLRWIDEAAAHLATEFNILHQTGIDLDGDTGVNFFEPVGVAFAPEAGNSLGAQISSGTVLDQTLLTFDDYAVVFTDPTTFDVVNVSTGATVISGAAYASGVTVSFDGIEITLGDLSGGPQTGDTFSVNTIDNAAANISVSADIRASSSNIAAGLSNAASDNENLLLLLELEDAGIVDGLALRNFINTHVADVGLKASQAKSELIAQDTIVNQISGYVEEISGVSLDEESTNLIIFQRAYQASARMISAMDEILQTLINIV